MKRDTDEHMPSRPEETIPGVTSPPPAEGEKNPRGRRPPRKSTPVVVIACLAVLCGAGAWAFLPQVLNNGQQEQAAATTQPATIATATPRPTPTLRLTDYTEPVHGFTVKFLSPPSHSRMTLALTEETTSTADVYSPENSGQSVMALPLPCMDPAHTTEVLQATLDATVKNSADSGKPGSAPPTMETRELTTVQSFAAVRANFTYTDYDGRTLRAQILTVMHGSTIIQVLALSGSSPDPLLDSGQKTFMESLRFLDRPAPGAPVCTDPSQLPGVSAS
ncbi:MULTISPECIES: hypothetical protein [Arthrobacter]|uniref:Uncharacterized protein n=1 Tax=Arthrobacter terricola TaxID=2547396 RepID=A0A4R5K7I1_9MICC|nr:MULTISPECIES: hypothetical protein [Arthrobacter]MBT8163783.1 hypothetical protein [Arthrobacter sp. GN70]TDF86745.1 hypothetical protein E1809_25570 [Arthrobacter terricola]